MPWKETRALDLKKSFIKAWERNEYSLAELCRQNGISRQTAYKWLHRYEEEGEEGLEERSRAPQNCPHRLEERVVEQVVACRIQHPTWGPRKLLAELARKKPRTAWPAASTVADVLKRQGLIVSRKKRVRVPAHNQPVVEVNDSNQVWCADFKGWFLTGDGQRCDPLTITDAWSRFVFRCQIVPKTNYREAQAVFEAAFREFGLPEKMRTDNGAPFASKAPGGLSRLAIWWLKLGIRPERIPPGKPQYNGRHERFHRTLKAETARPPAANLRKQQQRFQEFVKEFNQERPHEALGYAVPAQVHQYSCRPYPNRLPEIVYPDDMVLRRISQQGSLKWKSRREYITETLAYEVVGLRAVDERYWEVYFAHLKLGVLDTHKMQFRAARHKWASRHKQSC
jgi:transposase InsO family protein